MSIYTHNIHFIYNQWLGTGMKGIEDVYVNEEGKLRKFRSCEKAVSKLNTICRAKKEDDRKIKVQQTIIKSLKNCDKEKIQPKVLEKVKHCLISNNLIPKEIAESKHTPKINLKKSGYEIIKQITGLKLLPPSTVFEFGILQDHFCKVTVQGRPCVIVGQYHEDDFWDDIESELIKASHKGEIVLFSEGINSPDPDQQSQFQLVTGVQYKFNSKFLIGLEDFPLKMCVSCAEGLWDLARLLSILNEVALKLPFRAGGAKIIQKIANQSPLANEINKSIIENNYSDALKESIRKIFYQKDLMACITEGRQFLQLVGRNLMYSIKNLSEKNKAIFQNAFSDNPDTNVFALHRIQITRQQRDKQFAKVVRKYISLVPKDVPIVIHVGFAHLIPLKKLLEEKKQKSP